MESCQNFTPDVPRVPQNVRLADGPFVHQFDIAEDRRLLYAMLLQTIPN